MLAPGKQDIAGLGVVYEEGKERDKFRRKRDDLAARRPTLGVVSLSMDFA